MGVFEHTRVDVRWNGHGWRITFPRIAAFPRGLGAHPGFLAVAGRREAARRHRPPPRVPPGRPRPRGRAGLRRSAVPADPHDPDRVAEALPAREGRRLRGSCGGFRRRGDKPLSACRPRRGRRPFPRVVPVDRDREANVPGIGLGMADGQKSTVEGGRWFTVRNLRKKGAPTVGRSRMADGGRRRGCDRSPDLR